MNIFGINIRFDAKDKLRNFLYTYKGKAGFICFPNANVIIETIDSEEYKTVLNSSIMNICDGTAPMLYARVFYKSSVDKYTGPDYMLDVFNENNIKKSHFFIGSTSSVLETLKQKLSYSKCNIVGLYSPPFKKVTEFDYQYIASLVNKSGAKIIWVSLGAPKQEIFMYNLIKYLDDSIICLGVGAAFDFHAGSLKRAPLFFQKNGIEWLYRIIKEPRRLFVRYMYVNTKFVILSCITFIKNRISVQ